jgi:hypothetical protein
LTFSGMKNFKSHEQLLKSASLNTFSYKFLSFGCFHAW